MDQLKETNVSLVPWKLYITTTVESLLAFYIATFCVGMFFMHRGVNWVMPALLLAFLYLFVIFVCAKRVMQKLPIAAIMLIIPIAPLIALIIVVSLIPVIEKFI